MKDLLGLLEKRRSIRRFSTKKIRRQEMHRILEAGRWAPSGLNNQPWRFLVVTDRPEKKGLAAYTRYGSVIASSAATFVVCLDTADSYNRDKDIMAIGACIQNMLMEAWSLGIGSCWLGEILNRRQEVTQYLKLDSDLEIMAVIAFGYSAQKPSQGCRKPLKKLVLNTNKRLIL